MNTKKLFTAILATLLMLFIISSLYIKYSKNEIKITYEPYIVSQGETLWSISVNCNLRQDIRETIYQIRKKNKLDDVVIYPGQELLVPIVSE